MITFVVAHSQPVELSEINQDDLLTLKKDKSNKVEAPKEQSMKRLFQQRFEDDLKQVALALSKKGGTKKYDKVLKRIGRLQQKYAAIDQYYEINVKRKEQIATAIEYKFAKQDKAEQRFSGSYSLRTSRADLNEKEIWSLYVMLTHVEDAFRSLKSELELRPIYHQKEQRSDAHLFIAVLAYHLLNTISELYKSRWEIEEFFKEIKQHLKIKSFIGTSENAVMIQIWTAMITILMLKFLKALAQYSWHLSNLVSFLRLNLFVKINLQKWLDAPFEKDVGKPHDNQLSLF